MVAEPVAAFVQTALDSLQHDGRADGSTPGHGKRGGETRASRAASGGLGVSAMLRRHLRWQRQQLAHSAKRDAARFLVLRPGDKLTICERSGMHNLRAHCFRGAGSRSGTRAGAHWDQFMLERNPGKMRPIPGLGNIALSLVSAAVTAIVSRRVLLVENASSLAASFGSPFDEIDAEASGWMPALLAAQGSGSSRDSFAAHDDFTAFDGLCGADLRVSPPERVWRLFSNQYWLPLLLLNPHHAPEIEAMAEEARGAVSARGGALAGGARAARALPVRRSPRGLWAPVLRGLLRPNSALQAELDLFAAASHRGAPLVGMHIRTELTSSEGSPTPRLRKAAACARQRLRANNASHLYVATMSDTNRHALAAQLRGMHVLWHGRAVGVQSASVNATSAAVFDLWAMGAAAEVLVTPGSTFGYVAHGLAGSRATQYGGTHTSREIIGEAMQGADCRDVGTSEPAFHFLKKAVGRYQSCRAGQRAALSRGSELYRLSSVMH